MLGDAEEWFYAGLGGITIDLSREDPERIVIRPAMLARVAWADVHYRSVLGEIRVAWKHEPGGTILDVTVPANSGATVVLPSEPVSAIRESGESISRARGVALLRTGGASPVFRVESGEYHFSISSPAGR